MAVGVGITCGGDRWEANQIRAVEELGYDSFWTGEHIVYHRPILEAITTLTYAAALTSRIKIGPATLLLPLRHPTMAAKQLSCLDVLSNGRVILTVGVGGDYPREFAACHVPLNERGRRASEAIEIMRKYWSGERFDYAGKIFQLADVDMLPKPVQPGGPPIWVSGRQEGPMRRAAILGDGWHPYMYTPKRCGESFAQVKLMAREAGRTLPNDYTFACFIYLCLHDDVAEARRRAGAELKYRYNQEFDHLVDKYCAYGPPPRVAEYLLQYIEAGVNYMILAPIMPPAERRTHLERLATHVLPLLKSAQPGQIV
jgi:probable F420-dependent oxidoreductase